MMGECSGLGHGAAGWVDGGSLTSFVRACDRPTAELAEQSAGGAALVCGGSAWRWQETRSAAARSSDLHLAAATAFESKYSSYS